MTWLPVAAIKHILGPIFAYVLMIVLSPVFLVLALLYILLHQARSDGTKEESPVGELTVTNR